MKLDIDPTNGFLKQANQAIHSSIAIKNAEKWKLKSLSPTPPVIKGLIKLHKEMNPIRPVVNMCSSPSYKLAGFVSKCLRNILCLPFSFNVKNSPQLIHDLLDLKFEPQYRLCSFDTISMYTNIPTDVLPNILQNIMEAQWVDTGYIKHILTLVQVVLGQNYFRHENELFQQIEGLAMGAPTSSLLSEVFLQSLEHNSIYNILVENKIVAYFRYVDDILIVHDNQETDIAHMLLLFNNLYPNLTFTMELEEDMKINFSDLAIHRLCIR
jgi:hypothetical protein